MFSWTKTAAVLTLLAALFAGPVSAVSMSDAFEMVVGAFRDKVYAEREISSPGGSERLEGAQDRYDELCERLAVSISRDSDGKAADLFVHRVQRLDRPSRLAFMPVMKAVSEGLLMTLNSPEADTDRSLSRIDRLSKVMDELRDRVPTDGEMAAFAEGRGVPTQTGRPEMGHAEVTPGANSGDVSMKAAAGAQVETIGISLTASDETGATLRVSFPPPGVARISTEKGLFQLVHTKGCGFTDQIGSPMLPASRIFLAIPGRKAKKVTIGGVTEREVTGVRPYPVQPPLLDIKGYKAPFTIDEKAYASAKAYPSALASAGFTGKVREYNLLMLEMFPVRFIGSENRLMVVESMTVRVDYEPGDSTAAGARSYREPGEGPGTSRDFQKMFGSMVMNSGALDSIGSGPDRSQNGTFDDTVHRVTPSNGADYLIIVHDDLADAIAPMVEWKKRKGLFPKVFKLSEVTSGDPDPEAIRNFVRKCYLNFKPRPTYLLLVGDVEQIPTFHRHTPTYGTFYGGNVGSDHYYGMTDGKDVMSDIFVGRLSVKTPEELSVVVDKIIDYERNPTLEDASWFKRALSVACKEEGRIFHETGMAAKAYFEGKGFSCEKAFSWEGDGTPEITTAFGKGLSMVVYRGHGEPDQWVEPYFGVSTVKVLGNRPMLPFIFATTCNSGAFDGTEDCFGEVLMKDDDAGAVGFLGASKPSYSFHNDEFLLGMLRAAFDDGMETVGQVMAQGQNYMTMKYGMSKKTEDMFEFYSILTDPSLALWTSVPERISIVAKEKVGKADKQFMVQAIGQDGKPAVGAKVTFFKDGDGFYRSGVTNASGRIAFRFNESKLTSGEFDLVVTGRNILPVEKKVPVER